MRKFRSLLVSFCCVAFSIVLVACGEKSKENQTSESTIDATSGEITSDKSTDGTTTESVTELTTETTTAQTTSKYKVGDIITLGSYEQDNDTSNGKEKIDWIILDVKDGKALLISKYGLEHKPYNAERVKITWENCSLREWLNNDFFDIAFDSNEKAIIQKTNITADKNRQYVTDPGNDTEDNVFLIGADEADKYFASDSERMCEVTPYALAQEVYVNEDGKSRWLLRTVGRSQYYVCVVYRSGVIYDKGSDVNGKNVVVRPSVWIDLNEY